MLKRKDLLKALDDERFTQEVPGYFWLGCCDCRLGHLVILDKHSKNKVKVAFMREPHSDTTAKRKEKSIIVKRNGKRKK